MQLQIRPTPNFLIAPDAVSLAIFQHFNLDLSPGKGSACDSPEMNV